MILILVLAAAVTVLAGCSGHPHASTRAPAAAPGRKMSFRLADSTTGPVSVSVPTQPVAVAGTTQPGVTLEVFAVQRVQSAAVLLVLGLKVASSAASISLEGSVIDGLSASGGNGSTVSGVSLFDPADLKQYETFMVNPRVDTTCLCSELNGSDFDDVNATVVVYLAALVAAPPLSDATVSVVTGLATIGHVSITP